MPNYFQDNSDIRFHLQHMDLGRVIDLWEDDYAEAATYPEAPVDADDAMDNYQRVLDIVGDIAANTVAPRAEEVDRVGARFENGDVILAPGTVESLDRLRKADLMGFTLPRAFGGLNLPKTIYTIATEIISRADAALMNLFGLQEIADTINKFGSAEQREKYLPRFASGAASGAMALTEPDAGSDLQAVMLKATQDADGTWRLNGVKRFITNGCADISLVMARSEPGTTGGRGLSLFIYERDSDLTIRRIEHKLGIHGSPTCELQFNNARAELLGKQKFGLVKYTMSLMNGARLAVAAQAVGIAEAAYRESAAYAADRIQFKKPIRRFSAVYELLVGMKVDIEAARTLLYETARIVDIKEGIEHRMERYPDRAGDLRDSEKRYSRYAALFTPMAKAVASEMANRVCYHAIQIHGGVGYTSEFPVERFYRDARITNIYEGTTQLQVVAAIGGVIGGVWIERLNDFESSHDFSPVSELMDDVHQWRDRTQQAVSHVKERNDAAFQEFHAARLVEMAAATITGYLMCIDALNSDRKKKIAKVYITTTRYHLQSIRDYILSNVTDPVIYQEDILDMDEADQCVIGSPETYSS